MNYLSSTTNFPSGIPNYVRGGTNTINIGAVGPDIFLICLGDTPVTLTYEIETCQNCNLIGYNGYCNQQGGNSVAANPYSRSMSNYNNWNAFLGTTGTSCDSNANNNDLLICNNVRTKSSAVMKIDASTLYNIRTQLPVYSKREGGIVIEMDLGYGYPSNGGRTNINPTTGFNDAIMVEAWIQEGTSVTNFNL